MKLPRWLGSRRDPEVITRHTHQSDVWHQFEDRVRAAGMRPRNCGSGHWRIEGGLNEVNWYPFSAKRTIYVNNTTARATIRFGSLDRAIAVANDPGALPMVGKYDKVKRGKNRGWRKDMLGVNPTCWWCNCRLDEETATTDHLIPLARGGTDSPTNRVLSCGPCNRARGHGTDWKGDSCGAVRREER